jgi:hypothetical protein
VCGPVGVPGALVLEDTVHLERQIASMERCDDLHADGESRIGEAGAHGGRRSKIRRYVPDRSQGGRPQRILGAFGLCAIPMPLPVVPRYGDHPVTRRPPIRRLSTPLR